MNVTEIRHWDEQGRQALNANLRRLAAQAGTTTVQRIIQTTTGGGDGGGVSDHGLLTGLADDDHPRYNDRVWAMFMGS